MTQTLGAYELEGELGRGTQGTVFRARHRPTGAIRAVKILAGRIDAETGERFRREAQALARAGEIAVTVHEVGNDAGRLWFAMDLCPGGTLADRIARSGKLDWREAAAFMSRLARGLDRAHEAGLIHRDLKPGNILFDDRGQARIADWGVVRDLGRSVLTVSGTLVGTPAYMAPEQLAGERVDRRADVYSLGVILHEVVAGAYPFPGRDWQEISTKIRSGAREPLAWLGAPAELDAIVLRALAWSPAARTGTAARLAAELDELLVGKTAPPRPRRRSAPVAALVLGAAALGAAVLSTRRGESPPPPPHRDVAPPSPAPLARPSVAPRIHADALWLAERIGTPMGLETEDGIAARIESLDANLPDLLRESPDVARAALEPIARLARRDAFDVARHEAFEGGLPGVRRRHEFVVEIFARFGLHEGGAANMSASFAPVLRHLPLALRAALLAGERYAPVEEALRDEGPRAGADVRGSWIAPLEESDPILAAAAWCAALRIQVEQGGPRRPALDAEALASVTLRYRHAEELATRASSEADRLWAGLLKHDLTLGLAQCQSRLASLATTMERADELRTEAVRLLRVVVASYPRSSFETLGEVRYDRQLRTDTTVLVFELLGLRREAEVSDDMLRMLGAHPFAAEVERRRGHAGRALELLARKPDDWLRPSALSVCALALADLGRFAEARATLVELEKSERAPGANNGIPGYPDSRAVASYVDARERAR
ncbi:MAG TPA: serine/threonine-protein kinase [Planctomycetota bacterium]|nr:serine/threonine-protein kinase [Planctomycetota bacterium]